MSHLSGLYRRTVVRGTRVVAVVGSFGKSTTTNAVVTALGGTPYPGSQRNVSSFLARALFRIRPGDRHGVIEVGIGGIGEMAPNARVIRPDIVVVTSIGSEHHTSLGTLETTRDEKAAMVRILPPSGLAVLNGDDPNVMWMRGQTRARVVTFGFGESNDVRADNVSLEDWPDGTRFTLHAGGESRDMRIRLIGRPMVYPILAAVAVALAEGFSLDRIQPGLEALDAIPGRLEPVRLPGGAVILRDDFKAAPETIDAALDVLAEIPATRRIVLLGPVTEPPGHQGELYRRLGSRIGSIASRAIFMCGKRNSNCSAGATAAGMPPSAIVKAGSDIFKIAEDLRRDVGPGDVVLIKGGKNLRPDRISLMLAGRTVRCRIKTCTTKAASCYHCPMLEQGWGK